MLLVENTAALIAFVMCLVCFALGYVLRNWTEEARAEFENTFTYGQRRANDGRR